MEILSTVIGDIALLRITASLMSKGYTVLKPISDSKRYDLVIEINGCFKRVQCKNGRYINGCVVFAGTSSIKGGSKRKVYHQTYVGQVEFFGVFCPTTNQVYFIPIEEVKKENYLRVESPKRNYKKIRWAKSYQI